MPAPTNRRGRARLGKGSRGSTCVPTWLPHPSRAVCESVGTLTFSVHPHRRRTAEHAARQPTTLSRVVQLTLSNPIAPDSQASRPHLPDCQGASCGRLDRGSQVRISQVTDAAPHPRRSLRSHRPGQGENHVLFFKTCAGPAVCLRLRHARAAFKPLPPAVRRARSSACVTPRALRLGRLKKKFKVAG